MEQNENIPSILELSDEQLYEYSQLLNELPIRYAKLHAKKDSYGTDDLLSVAEVHMLTQIADNPNITASELASYWNYTKGAISHIIKSLSEKELITRRRDSVDSLKIFLNVSDKGKKVSDYHKAGDAAYIRTQFTKLREVFTDEEIYTYLQIHRYYGELVRKLEK